MCFLPAQQRSLGQRYRVAGRDDELKENALDVAESSTDISERSVDGARERKTCAQGSLTQGVQRTGSGARACGNTRAHLELLLVFGLCT